MLPLLIVVNDVIGVGSKERSNFLILEDSIKEPDFIKMRFHAFITNTGEEGHEAANEVNFPQGSLREHHEGSANPSHKTTGPHIVGTVKSAAHLVNVITSTEAPFEVVVSENVVAELERVGVAVGLDWFIVSTVVHSIGVIVKMIIALGRFETQVVVRGIGVLTEASNLVVGQHSLKSQKVINQFCNVLKLTRTEMLVFYIIFNNYIIQTKFNQNLIWKVEINL